MAHPTQAPRQLQRPLRQRLRLLLAGATLAIAGCGGGEVLDSATAGVQAQPSDAQAQLLAEAGRKTILATAPATLNDSDALRYLCSYPDLRLSYGLNIEAAKAHYAQTGRAEGRTLTFEAERYVASYPDLMKSYGVNIDAAMRHFIARGAIEGRTVTFDALRYIASYTDLIRAYGTDTAAASLHYIGQGRSEGRSPRFEAERYLASYPDLAAAFGTDVESAMRHYINRGALVEGRTVTFDAMRYIASNADLILAYGTNTAAASIHYVTRGGMESRTARFNTAQYLANYDDLRTAYGDDIAAAARHYVAIGKAEGRTDSVVATNELPPPPAPPNASYFRLTLLRTVNGMLQVSDGAARIYTSGAYVPRGSRIVVTAQPQARFALAAWTGNAEVLCAVTADVCTIASATDDLILGAQFKLASFVHPGGLIDTEALTRIRNELARASDPALAAIGGSNAMMFAQQTWMPTPAQLDAGARINYKPNPTTILYRNYTGPGLGGGGGVAGNCPAIGTQCTAYGYKAGYEPDAYAAFDLALQHKITGRAQYADKAVEILNAWGSTFQQFAIANGSYDAMLEAYIYGYLYFTAAELLRDYPGWKTTESSAFRAMASRVFYPVLYNSLSYGGTDRWGYAPSNSFGWLGVWSNWFIGPLQSLAAYAILLDDADSFNYAIEYFKKGWTNGQIDRHIYYVHPGNLGQNNESVRDQGHTPLALGQLATFAQIAWGQGVDLYSYNNYRILAGAEYVAKSNLTTPAAIAGSCTDTRPESCYSVPTMWYQNFSALGTSGRGRNALYPLTVLTQVYEREFGLLAKYSRIAKSLGNLDGPGSESAPYSDLWVTRPYQYAGTPVQVTEPELLLCATENNNCTVPANTWVQFGTTSIWVGRSQSGTFSCSRGSFGVDPAPGVTKGCYTRSSKTSNGFYSARSPVLSGKMRAGGVQLSWYGSHGVSTYDVQRSTQRTGGYQTIATGITDLLTFTDQPTQAATYFYRVLGMDANGAVLTAPSNVLEVAAVQPRLRHELTWARNVNAYENDANSAIFYGTLGKGVTRMVDGGVPVLSFDGSKDAYVRLPDNLNLGLGDFTVSTWVNWPGQPSWISLWSVGNSGARYTAIQLDSNRGTAFVASLNGGGDQQTLIGPKLPLNTWAHVAVSFSGTYCSAFNASGTCTSGGNTATLYINGQQAGQLSGYRTDPDDIGTTTQNHLGRSQYPQDANFNGKLGNFRIYEGALSATQIQQLYQTGRNPARP